MKKQFLLVLLFVFSAMSFAQLPPAGFEDGIETDFVDMYSNTQTQINAWSIPSGITRLAWNVTEQELQWYNGSEWVCISCSEIPTLQQVTEAGATTDQEVTFESGIVLGDNTGAPVLINFDGTSGTAQIQFLDGNVDIAGSGGITLNTENLLSGSGGNRRVFTLKPSGWDASTNTPTLANTDTNVYGLVYPVIGAGTVDFGAGNITFGVDDYVGYINGAWVKVIDNNQSGSTPTLQLVTDEGATSTNNIVVNNGASGYFNTADNTNFRYSYLYADKILFSRNANNLSINTPTLTGTRAFDLRDGDVDLTGGSDGDVLTVQADGSVEFETPSGTPGTDGSSVLSGSVDPTTEGVDGDFYINTTSYEIFGPKASGVWGSGTSLVGPTGATGATGANGTLAPWEGEFNRDFVFDSSTALLNQTDTSGSTVFVSNYNDTFINGGQNYDIVDFDCHPDDSNAINIIYGDFNSTSTTTIAASAVDNLPAIPTGRSRLVLGICIERSAGDHVLYSKYFRLPQERSDYYPFDKDVVNRSGALKAVTDIKDIKLYINNPENLYTNGRLNKIRPNIMSNGALFRWQMYDYEGNLLGFIGAETIASQSGVQTITLAQSPVSGSTLGVTLEITMDFDLFSGTTQYTYSDDWFLDDSILLEAIHRWNSIETTDFIYTDVLSSLSKIKLNDGEDTGIALFGDSMWTWLNNNEDSPNPENLPPSCQVKYIPYWLFVNAVENKPQYDRFDSTVNTFTESGTFTDGDNFGAFSTKYGGELMRYSSTSSAYVEWDWDLSAYEKLNFIYAEDDGNSNNLTVTVSTGTGDVEVYNGTTWVEANSFTFDQIAEPVNASLGNLGYSFNHRLKFRRVSTSGTPTIRIAKGANADVLYYWGTERYNGNTIWFNNEGYSANSLSLLKGKYNSSLFSPNKHHNIILCTFTLINDSGANLTTLRNDYQDFVWGDRVGFENANSLKNLSNDWVDFQVIPILPQKPDILFNTDGTRTSQTAHRKWNVAIELLESQGDLGYIDYNIPVMSEARLRGVNRYDIIKGFSGNPNDYYTLTTDGGHFNILGCQLVSKIISPLFWN